MLELLWLPFLACLVLTGIHVYLGLHVLARGVIFVDLALAQIAALGISVAVLAGHPIRSRPASWDGLACTLGGAAVSALSPPHAAPVPAEAVIGIVYAVSAAVAVLVVARAPQGSEHIKQLLVGSILTVTPREVATVALLYAALGVIHWLIRRPLLDISLDPAGARARGRAVAVWDFVFYTSFGLVVTSSVRLAGVLLVFSYLIIPAVVGALLAHGVLSRLVIGWSLGLIASAFGILAAWTWDLPTGAAIVTTFGVMLAAVAIVLGVVVLRRRVIETGAGAIDGVLMQTGCVITLAGGALLAFPAMDQPWLAAVGHAVPGAALALVAHGGSEES